jgi:hypothetical protein
MTRDARSRGQAHLVEGVEDPKVVDEGSGSIGREEGVVHFAF